MPKEWRLALLIKAFNLHIAGKKVSRGGLHVKDNEKFPHIDPLPMADAADDKGGRETCPFSSMEIPL